MAGSILILALLGITALLVVAIALVIVIVSRQGRQVDRLAGQIRQLSEHAERHAEQEPPAKQE